MWDRLAQLVYAENEAADPRAEDLVDRALNAPGGVLAWTLISHFEASKPGPGAGLGDLETRFNVIARADSESGLLGRVHFARALNYLHRTAPDWTNAEILPRFREEHPEALAMWKANAQTRAGSAVLFNTLKAPLLAMIPRPELRDIEADNLATRLLDVLVSRQLGSGQDYELTPAEVRNLLAVSPERVREHFAWLLWRLQSDDAPWDGQMAAKGTRWRELVGPIFEPIWPLDARLRTERASQDLVQMAMNTDDAFPEAVHAVVDVLAPFELYLLEHTLRLESAHTGLIERYPTAIIKLTSALIDPMLHPIPRDLNKLLDDCKKLDPQIIHDPSFLRLNGFRRLASA